MEKYLCKYCGTEIDWGSIDDKKGNIFCCDVCGDYFCSDCWEKHNKQSISVLMDMARCLCPDCM